ncbi:DUF2970 domain-containing protein [Magnetococcales bacterium HHB-1]
MTEAQPAKKETSDQEGLTIFQVMGSVAAALFGVQSRKNRDRDFTHGKPMQFAVVGLIFTILFILTLVSVAYLAISG